MQVSDGDPILYLLPVEFCSLSIPPSVMCECVSEITLIVFPQALFTLFFQVPYWSRTFQLG